MCGANETKTGIAYESSLYGYPSRMPVLQQILDDSDSSASDYFPKRGLKQLQTYLTWLNLPGRFIQIGSIFD